MHSLAQAHTIRCNRVTPCVPDTDTRTILAAHSPKREFAQANLFPSTTHVRTHTNTNKNQQQCRGAFGSVDVRLRACMRTPLAHND